MTPTLSDRIAAGDPRAIARGISLIENETPEGAALVRRIFARTGRAYLVGVTGPPGAGKSTLVDRLTSELRARGRTVGIVAVDPTSPYSGGAILGDRVRMQSHAADPGVFIRSMATRGHLGGLARATSEAALVLDAAGKDVVLIETVGVGQDEIDIVRTADVSIVTVVPGTGDDVQAIKAGIMEIADIFVVNKADREGADRTAVTIEAMLSQQNWEPGEWKPPVLRTEATTGKGVTALVEAIDAFRRHQTSSGEGRHRERAEFRLRELLEYRFLQQVQQEVLRPGELREVLEQIAERTVDPYTAADDILRRALGRRAGAPGPRLDHVGVAVADLNEALAFYRDELGLVVHASEEVGSQRVRAHFVPAGSVALELLEATAEDSPIAKYVARRGPGLHHLTFEVDDIVATLARLHERGVRLIDQSPRPGAEGCLVAFIHPSSAHGVLVELKERPASA